MLFLPRKLLYGLLRGEAAQEDEAGEDEAAQDEEAQESLAPQASNRG